MDNWGFFSPAGTWSHGTYAWSPFGWIQFAGIIFFIVLFSTLFWAKPFYKFLARKSSVTITLGVLYLVMYLVYYIINITYFYTTFNSVANGVDFNIFQLHFNQITPKMPAPPNFGEPPVSPPQDIIPLHLSSMGQICAATLLITRNKKLFNLSFPFLGVLPIMAIIAPSKVFYGPQNYFYYDYFLNHSAMITIYWWMYMYGIRKYNVHCIRFNFIFAVGLAILAFIFDWVFNTNLMFVGSDGYPFNANTSTTNLLWSPSSNFQSLLCMVFLGSTSLFIAYLLIVLWKPLYIFEPSLNKFTKAQKRQLAEAKEALTKIFIWNKKYLSKCLI